MTTSVLPSALGMSWGGGKRTAEAAGLDGYQVQARFSTPSPHGPIAFATSPATWQQSAPPSAASQFQQAGDYNHPAPAGWWQQSAAPTANASWKAAGTDWDSGKKAGWWQSASTEKQSWDSAQGSSWSNKGRSSGAWSQGSGDTQEEEEEWKVAAPNPEWAFLSPVASGEQTRAFAEARRAALEIVVTGEAPESAIPPIDTFQELAGALPEYVVETMKEAGMVAPMPIQAQALPIVLRGYDFIGIAKTGSGKTLGFLLPAVVHIETQRPLAVGEVTPIALVMAPVRELAVQIGEEANKILGRSKEGNHPRGIGAVSIYGGGFRVRGNQVWELQKGWCHIVVGTPGRVVDLLDSGELVLSRVSCLVLDEADRMLDEGFGEQLAKIESAVRPNRQTLYFSATWPTEVQKLAKQMCHCSPVRVSIGQNEAGSGPTTRSDIVQEVVVFDGGDWEDITARKQERLYTHLRTLLRVEAHKVLVFVNMKSLAWELAGKLNEEGFKADFMYGGRSQDSRHAVVQSFKDGTIKLLVTTDVMARGLDIPGISHVVVYDCYGGIDEYVHRIGRTARGPYGCGHALIFFEYDAKYSEMASEVINVLQSAGQVVPPELQKIADEVASGQRAAKWKKKW